MPGLKLDADAQAQNVKQKVARKKRMAVTINDAAELCDLSPSTIKKWERGENTPEGWPGRGDLMVLKAFANTREGRRKLKKAIKNAARIGDMDKISRHVAR
jgi:transcriptional regulator with XRE-family HTH domain